jgi:hypothetical protein
MKIRPAGSFFSIDEAMKRVKEVHSIKELKECLLTDFGGEYYKLDTLKCRYYCEDERIGWHTYLLTADLADGRYEQQAVVFADSPIENLPME